MKSLVILALLALTACDEPTPRSGMILVCTSNGQETYRSPRQGYWYFREGAWQANWSGAQYSPSYTESCHSEEVP